MPSAKATLTGDETLHKVLAGLAADVRSELLEKACGDAALPIKEAMVRFAPKRTGALKASIAVKTISNKFAGTAAALIGPSRDYFAGGKRLGRGADRRGANKPANYAHLVEFGHYSGAATGVSASTEKGKRRRGKRNFTERSFVLPQPFIRPGFAAGRPAAEAILAAELGEKLRIGATTRGAA